MIKLSDNEEIVTAVGKWYITYIGERSGSRYWLSHRCNYAISATSAIAVYTKNKPFCNRCRAEVPSKVMTIFRLLEPRWLIG